MRVAMGNVNLTAVLITLIICVTLYSMCKIARQDEKKQKNKGREAQEDKNSRDLHVVRGEPGRRI